MTKPLRSFSALVTLAFLLTAAACGRVITRPTPAPATPTPTPTSSPQPPARPTATPAPYTPEPTATPTVTPTPIIHTIARGETLIAIARKYGVSVAAIQEANGILDPRSLRVGQQLAIPSENEQGQPVAIDTPTPTPLPLTIGPLYFGNNPAGGLWVLGEVINSGAEAVEGMKVAISLLDAGNQPVAAGEALVSTDMLNPSQRGPFGVLLAAAPANFVGYQAQMIRAAPAHLGLYYRDLEVADVVWDGERYQSYRVSGRIRNIGPEQAVAVEIVATLYDALGQVIGFRRGPAEHNIIAPGGETSFTIDVIPLGGPVATVRVIAEGRRQVTPTPAP